MTEKSTSKEISKNQIYSVTKNMIDIACFPKNKSTIRNFLGRSLIGINKNPITLLSALYYTASLLNNDRVSIFNMSEDEIGTLSIVATTTKFLPNRTILKLYFTAWSFYLKGEYQTASKILDITVNLNHEESRILRALIAQRTSTINDVYKYLEPVLYRKRTWILLLDSVKDEKDFELLFSIYTKSLDVNIISKDDFFIVEKLVNAAKNAELYSQAFELLNSIPVDLRKSLHSKAKSLKQKINKKYARDALLSITSIAKKFDINLFLISGTLLGYCRKKSFLEHDTDIDLGVFKQDKLNEFFEELTKTGLFVLINKITENGIKLKHINGTVTDIFIHKQDKDDYWHAVEMVSWHNSPFELQKVNFLGIEINIPDKPELYLEENYGKDWYIPKEKFDSILDCPNLKIKNNKLIELYKLQNFRG